MSQLGGGPAPPLDCRPLHHDAECQDERGLSPAGGRRGHPGRGQVNPPLRVQPQLHAWEIPRALGVEGGIASEVCIKGSRRLKITKNTSFPRPGRDAGQGAGPNVFARCPLSQSSGPGRASCHPSLPCTPPPLRLPKWWPSEAVLCH